MAKLRVNKIAAVGVSTETTGSVFFDGTDDFMSLDGSSDFAFGTGDFTIEFWVYFNAGSFSDNSVDPNLFDFRPFNTQGAYPSISYDTSANNLRYYVDTGNRIDGGQLSDQTWYHIALEREGTSTKMYVNGSQVGSTYSDSNDYVVGTNRPVIACQGHNPDSNDRRLDGYISNFRICKGHAVYTENFTPPTRELEVHPETVFLGLYDGENIFAEKTGKIIAAYGDRLSSPTPTATDSPIGITTNNPGLTRNVDQTAGPTFQGGVGYNSQNWLTLPKGTTEQRGRGRGLLAGGITPTRQNIIEFVNIASTGNIQDFGDLTRALNGAGGCASATRGLFGGGYNPSVNDNTIEFVTIATTGNAVDFGDLLYAPTAPGGLSNNTRGIFAGGDAPSSVNNINFVTISTLGDAKDFGDLLKKRRQNFGSCSSPTRGLFAGGYDDTSPASRTNVIEYITIATAGNGLNFGDLNAELSFGISGVSSKTRGVFMGGYAAPAGVNTIQYVTIATTGNAQDFGDLTISYFARGGGVSNSERGLAAGGANPSLTNTIDYITIATTGDAKDFGDLLVARRHPGGLSDSHGGIS